MLCSELHVLILVSVTDDLGKVIGFAQCIHISHHLLYKASQLLTRQVCSCLVFHALRGCRRVQLLQECVCGVGTHLHLCVYAVTLNHVSDSRENRSKSEKIGLSQFVYFLLF